MQRGKRVRVDRLQLGDDLLRQAAQLDQIQVDRDAVSVLQLERQYLIQVLARRAGLGFGPGLGDALGAVRFEQPATCLG
jgi:hypothetical protein